MTSKTARRDYETREAYFGHRLAESTASIVSRFVTQGTAFKDNTGRDGEIDTGNACADGHESQSSRDKDHSKQRRENVNNLTDRDSLVERTPQPSVLTDLRYAVEGGAERE